MADRRNLCVFDFETGGVDTRSCEIIQIGALILHRSNFKTLSTFKSLMKPKDFDGLEQDALDINHITKEELENAPEASVVWKEFANWINAYNFSRDKSFFGAPVACGYNITGFDSILFDRYCKEYGCWDEKQNRQTLFWPLNRLDVFDYMWMLFRTNTDIKRMKLTVIAEYCGVPIEEIEKGAHDAMWDVEITAKLAVKLLKLFNRLTEVNPETGRRILNIKDCLLPTEATNG